MFIMYFFGHPLSYSTMALALILVGGMASLAVASALIMIETPTSKAGNAVLKSLCMTLEMFLV